MKLSCKAALAMLLAALLMAALVGCTPNEPTQTDPPETTLSEPEEHVDTVFDGIGTICDIITYGEDYLVLSHTGLYTVDKEMKTRTRLGSPYNDPFDGNQDYTNSDFFKTLTASTDYGEKKFSFLAATGEHIFFYCDSQRTFYLDGNEQPLGLVGAPLAKSARAYACGGDLYVHIDDLGYGTVLFRNGIQTERHPAKHYSGIVVHQDTPYLESYDDEQRLYWTPLNTDLSLGEPTAQNSVSLSYQVLSYRDAAVAGQTGSYRYKYTLDLGESSFHYAFSRTDGSVLEELVCGGLDECLIQADSFFWFVRDDRQFVLILCKDGETSIRTLNFDTKQD